VPALLILTAEDFKALNPLERQVTRRAARQQPFVRLILETFFQRGGPIPVEEIIAGSPDGAEAVHDALVGLDDDDLIRVRAGQIDIANPFSAAPTPFRLRLSGGRDRYACCAMDALGLAPMIAEAIDIKSHAIIAAFPWSSPRLRTDLDLMPPALWCGSASVTTSGARLRTPSERRSTSSGRKTI
jgi:hypothetical protein